MNNENKININSYPGHMAKAKREINEKISLIDIVIEVIDARIPLSSKNKDIDNIGKDKPRLLLMTKKDLCDINITNKWVKYYEEKGSKVILLDLLHEKNMSKVLDQISIISKKINEKRKNKGLKPRKTRIIILGIPNVGKSTLINRLVGKRAVNVGNKPGITKNLEWIRINKEIELLDTPGILWPRLEGENIALNLASTTAIKEEILDKEQIAYYIINTLIKYYPKYLKARYQLEHLSNIEGIIDNIAKKIGAISKNGTDYNKVYTIILKDLREGAFGPVTLDQQI